MLTQALTPDVRPSPGAATHPAWSVAIITSREQIDVLSETLDAVLVAVRGRDCVVDVIANGNPALAERAATYVRSLPKDSVGVTIRVWSIALGDKSHAINECINRLWPGSEIAFFVDGYAKVVPIALSAIDTGLREAPEAKAASGVPSSGRSAAFIRNALLTEGGITGALYAVRGTMMQDMRRLGFRLPLGMYRTDPTLGAAICFDLNPAANDWNQRRIVVCADATFTVRPKSPFQLSDLKTHFNRLVNVTWGAFIVEAVKNHLAVRRRAPEEMPGTALQLVRAWAKECPLHALLLAARRPLVFLALRRAQNLQNWSSVGIPPKLLIEVKG